MFLHACVCVPQVKAPKGLKTMSNLRISVTLSLFSQIQSTASWSNQAEGDVLYISRGFVNHINHQTHLQVALTSLLHL